MGSQLFQNQKMEAAWSELKEAVKLLLADTSSPQASQCHANDNLKEKQKKFFEAALASAHGPAEEMLAIRYVHMKAMQINLSIKRALFATHPFIDAGTLADAEKMMAKSELDYVEELLHTHTAASTLQKRWRRIRIKRLRIRTPSYSDSDSENEEENSGERAPIGY